MSDHVEPVSEWEEDDEAELPEMSDEEFEQLRADLRESARVSVQESYTFDDLKPLVGQWGFFDAEAGDFTAQVKMDVMESTGEGVIVELFLVEDGEISEEGEILSDLLGSSEDFVVEPDSTWRAATLADYPPGARKDEEGQGS